MNAVINCLLYYQYIGTLLILEKIFLGDNKLYISEGFNSLCF